MEHTPDEVFEYIFGYVQDKMNISMTCKLWKKILIDLFKKPHKIDYNDSYCLKTHYNVKNIMVFKNNVRFHGIFLDPDMSGQYKCTDYNIDSNIKNITNCKSLNFITKLFYDYYKTRFRASIEGTNLSVPKLLQQHCIINNVSKPKYINRLLYDVSDKQMSTALSCALAHNSYDIVKLILVNPLMFSRSLNWIGIIIARYEDSPTLEEVIKEIDFVINAKLLSVTCLYSQVCKFETDSPIKIQTLQYLEQFLDKDIIKYIQIK
jgi:hypothetical protein